MGAFSWQDESTQVSLAAGYGCLSLEDGSCLAVEADTEAEAESEVKAHGIASRV